MDERLKFIARLLDGEKMAVLCRQFGISRKTGYKILTRYNEIGLEGREREWLATILPISCKSNAVLPCQNSQLSQGGRLILQSQRSE
jgi:Homeodomain-like domain-containing protein